jgi:5-methylcytosine-specific restriction enzyme subunit McrC
VRDLTVREHSSISDLALSPADVGVIRSVAPKVALTPSLTPGLFDIETTSWIGAIRGETIALRIVPKVPIDRVLFMIAYSVNPAKWRDALFGFRREAGLEEIVAWGFARAAGTALEQGLLRGYMGRDEALQTIRGRVRFSDQLRDRFGRFPPVEVTFDDYTEDIEENRILRAAIDSLGRLQLRSPVVMQHLRALDWHLQNVAFVEYGPGGLPEFHWTRLNERYRSAVDLARLILQSASFRLEHGIVRSSSFLIDMNDVFEDFVRVALREALHTDNRHFPKAARGRYLRLDSDGRIALEPDLSWWSGKQCVFIGDVKYKRAGAGGAGNPDVYQALAYAVATGLPSATLIYASADLPTARLRIREAQRTIEVRSLDLKKEPEALLEDVGELAREIREASGGCVAA